MNTRKNNFAPDMSAKLGLLTAAEVLGDREIGGVAASSELARDGHVLDVAGLNLANFRNNPIVLANHNPDHPIGSVTAMSVVRGNLCVRMEFAPAGVSSIADEYCGLAKAGVISAFSVGFDPIEVEPLDPKQGSRGGVRITQSELLEISLTAVPADAQARVMARAHCASESVVAMLRSLPGLPRHSVIRAMAQVGRPPRTPAGLMSDVERTRYYAEEQRQRTMAVWASGQARVVGERDQYEQRQAEIRRLGLKH